MVALAIGGREQLAGIRPRAPRRLAVVHDRDAPAFPRPWVRGHGAVLHHRRGRVRGDRELEGLPGDSRSRALRRRLAAGLSGQRACPRRLPALAPQDDRAVRGRSATHGPTPSIFLIDAPTADVSATAIRAAVARAASRSRAWCRRRCSQHIEQHALYSARHLPANAAPTRIERPRQAGCMAKTDKRRKPVRLPEQVVHARSRRRRQEGDGPRRARPSQGRRVHGLLRASARAATRGRSAPSPTR